MRQTKVPGKRSYASLSRWLSQRNEPCEDDERGVPKRKCTVFERSWTSTPADEMYYDEFEVYDDASTGMRDSGVQD